MKLSDFQTYSSNPYLPKIPSSVFKDKVTHQKRQSGVSAVNSETGEVIGNMPAFIRREKLTDIRLFSKMFDGNCYKLCRLNIYGMKLFFYVLEILKYEDSVIDISPDNAREFCGYSTLKMVYSGIGNLLEHDIISRADMRRSAYYVNPMVMFSGDFAKIYSDWLSKKNQMEALKNVLKESGEKQDVKILEEFTG